MKTKLKLISIVLFTAIVNAKADRITKEKSNGGCNGYSYVKETHSTDNKTHSLVCKDPGNEKCEWEYPPIKQGYPVTIVDDITLMVEQLVLNGNTSGSFWYQNYGTIHVTYTNGNIINCSSGNIAEFLLDIVFH